MSQNRLLPLAALSTTLTSACGEFDPSKYYHPLEQTEAGLDPCIPGSAFDFSLAKSSSNAQLNEGEICERVERISRNIACHLSRPWSVKLYDYADERVSADGEITYVSDAYGDIGVPGEMICSHAGYTDKKGIKKESVDCDLWNPKTSEDLAFWVWQSSEYPEYKEVGGLVLTKDAKDFIDFASFMDGESTENHDANQAYAWIWGLEIQDYKGASCTDSHWTNMETIGEQMIGIAHFVVDR